MICFDKCAPAGRKATCKICSKCDHLCRCGSKKFLFERKLTVQELENIERDARREQLVDRGIPGRKR